MNDSARSVSIERTETGRYRVRSAHGAEIDVGGDGFTPVELLLAAIGTCTAIDTDTATSRHAEPDEFTVTVTGDKVSDRDTGNHLENLAVTFTVRFPEGEQGDRARAMLPRTVALSHDKLCTVGRTVERESPVRTVIE